MDKGVAFVKRELMKALEQCWVKEFEDRFTFVEKEGEEFFKMSTTPKDVKMFISTLIVDTLESK